MSGGARERWALRVLSGEQRGVPATLLRGSLRLIEPFYASIMRTRNALYATHFFAEHKLPRPTIAIGNLTTGGTGKTPLVLWLANELADRGRRPAILMRGYRSTATGGAGDEQRLLQNALGNRAVVVANPDRRAGALAAMAQTPQPDVFILDDAFQHRRVARDLDVLLISATNPFGHGHVLPRGLLREPISGLARANVIVVTRANLVAPDALSAIEKRIRKCAPNVPLIFAEHVNTAVRNAAGEALELDELRRRRFLLFTGIADPRSLEGELHQTYADTFAAARFYPDHHAFDDADLLELRRAAAEVNAHVLLTSDKDWVKIAPLATARDGLPILRLVLQLRFRDDGDRKLLEMVERCLTGSSKESSSVTATDPQQDPANSQNSANAANSANSANAG